MEQIPLIPLGQSFCYNSRHSLLPVNTLQTDSTVCLPRKIEHFKTQDETRKYFVSCYLPFGERNLLRSTDCSTSNNVSTLLLTCTSSRANFSSVSVFFLPVVSMHFHRTSEDLVSQQNNRRGFFSVRAPRYALKQTTSLSQPSFSLVLVALFHTLCPLEPQT